MGEEERRRCCALGGCGCGSGGPEQRAALKSFFSEKLAAHNGSEAAEVEGVVDGWLDELFKPEDSTAG
jgi:hypothetical protein